MRLDGSIVLNPGLLRDQITWQSRAVTSQNTFGEDAPPAAGSDGWADFVTCRAQVLAISGGNEVYQGSQFYGLAKYQITQHYTKGLQVAMRICWLIDGGMLYLNPLSIDPAPGMRQYQIILAKDYEA